jgi:hypothetical protein
MHVQHPRGHADKVEIVISGHCVPVDRRTGPEPAFRAYL